MITFVVIFGSSMLSPPNAVTLDSAVKHNHELQMDKYFNLHSVAAKISQCPAWDSHHWHHYHLLCHAGALPVWPW